MSLSGVISDALKIPEPGARYLLALYSGEVEYITTTTAMRNAND